MEVKFARCLQACYDCIEACNDCLAQCLQADDRTSLEVYSRLNRECANICMYTVDALTKKSSFDHQIFSLCAEICERCAAKFEQNQYMSCKRCAKVCLRCAEACRVFTSVA